MLQDRRDNSQSLIIICHEKLVHGVFNKIFSLLQQQTVIRMFDFIIPKGLISLICVQAHEDFEICQLEVSQRVHMVLAAYVAEDCLVRNQWEDRSLVL